MNEPLNPMVTGARINCHHSRMWQLLVGYCPNVATTINHRMTLFDHRIVTTHMLNKFIKTARGDDIEWEKTALVCDNAFCFRSNMAQGGSNIWTVTD